VFVLKFSNILFSVALDIDKQTNEENYSRMGVSQIVVLSEQTIF
jgi:hypothetical protein